MNDEYIRKRIKDFSWYQPVNFGKGLVVTRGNSLAPTDIDNINFGMGKWNYIIQRNLPDLQGKKVLDIGCNSGTFCMQMARMGAIEVVGIDSEKHWSQSWKEQAEFIKDALEWRCNTTYPIRYIDCEMNRIPEIKLGKFDVVIALCCIYYLEEDQIINLLSYFKENSDYVLLQGNTRREDQRPEVHKRALPHYLGRLMKKVGFPYIYYDKPLFYTRPVIVGSNYKVVRDKGRILSRAGLLNRLRQML